MSGPMKHLYRKQEGILKLMAMIALIWIVFKTTPKDIQSIHNWLCTGLMVPLVKLLCPIQWIQQPRQLSEVLTTIVAPVMQNNAGNFRGRLEEMAMASVIRATWLSILCFPSVMFAPLKQEDWCTIACHQSLSKETLAHQMICQAPPLPYFVSTGMPWPWLVLASVLKSTPRHSRHRTAPKSSKECHHWLHKAIEDTQTASPEKPKRKRN